MTLEQQIALLNDNVGNLVSKSDQLTGTIEDRLQEYEEWKGTINKPNPVILQVGADKEFTHPVDVATHIENNSLAGDILWKIEIDPGIYEFPHQGIHEMKFSYHKNVQIIGTSENAGDIIFRYAGDERHYMIICERNTHIDVKNISLKGVTGFTGTFISQIKDRSLRDGMAGGGLAHGILCRFNSSAVIENCNFNRLWHAIHCHDGCKIDISNITATELYGGVHCTGNSRIYIKRSSLRGVGAGTGATAPWAALGAFHCSSIFGYGVECRDFHMGLYCHWTSDFHFHQAYDYDTDGITKINIKNGHIENCYHAIHAWHYSGGNVNNALAKNIESNAITSGQSSNVHANSNVTVDGANIGFYTIHSSCLIANSSTARNCRHTAYYSAHKSEMHAASTSSRLSGNAVNYSPGGSHALGNHDSYNYFS